MNYSRSVAGLDSSYTSHPAKGTNPFFATPPTMENNAEVLHFQKKFIKRIMEISLDYGNVLYNTGNEHQVEMKEWDHYWCDFIRNYADSVGKRIETTAMFDHQHFHPVVNHHDIYSFVEGSKIGSRWTEPGETQYEDAAKLISQTTDVEPRPVNAVKVRTQNIIYNAQERLWRPLMAGFAALSHHRHTSGFTSGKGAGKVDDMGTWPVGGLGVTEMAKSNLRAMRLFTDIIVPWECIPRQDLLSERKEDEAYLLAREGVRYGLYFPKSSGSVKLDLINQRKSFKVQWIDIGKGEISQKSTIDGGELLSIKVPYQVEHGWSCCITAIQYE
jgi:hypothetical protein